MSDVELIRVDSVTVVSRPKAKPDALEAAVIAEAAQVEAAPEESAPKPAKKKG